ncbi:MAG: NAD-binding protein [Candidatus Cloacimonetes bacterium]|nr:NAD-binding protein [Candidatus Cloacimonadota bacterium]
MTCSDHLQRRISKILTKAGLKDIAGKTDINDDENKKEILLLGFYRVASSLLSEVLVSEEEKILSSVKQKIIVVDFNPEIHQLLKKKGIKALYGDVSHLDSLRNINMQDIKLIISTIPDTILVGTNNNRLVRQMKVLCPQAKIIVTADSIVHAENMYKSGADYVFLPRILSARSIGKIIELIMSNSVEEINEFINSEKEDLKNRVELMR